jgi:nicotinamide mononucleotide transporter
VTLDPIEAVAAVATLCNVWLTIRTSLWSWAWGVVAVVAYAVVFWQASLWSSMTLQLAYYLPMQAIGWWTWLRAGPTGDDDLPVTRLGARGRAIAVLVAVALTLVLGTTMTRLGASQSWADAGVTAVSVVGQALMTRKVIEHWACWVLVNAVYAGWMLPRQGLWLSVALYAVLLVLALRGWRDWARSLGAPHPAAA